jgi:hypothetical protein
MLQQDIHGILEAMSMDGWNGLFFKFLWLMFGACLAFLREATLLILSFEGGGSGQS